jgi:phenylalanyl-tRNA synthetase alpha chain
MKFDLQQVRKDFSDQLSKAQNLGDLEQIKLKYLGRKKGVLTLITQQIPKLPPLERTGVGTTIKEIRAFFEQSLLKKKDELEGGIPSVGLDFTTPGEKPQIGSIHPLTQVFEDVREIFHALGFSTVESPEIETDLYNFQKLNIPPDHPARDVQQTYYIDNEVLLRTHTSNMQVRYMEAHQPPLRVLFPGRVFRRDMPDSTHFPSFNQIEGLLVDREVSLAHLIGTLRFFVKSFFGEEVEMRIYGHHFPYTEPSIEVEIKHPEKGWLEILGAGMVHPFVLKSAGLDPEEFSGFAFGMGADRLAMLKYQINDIRVLFNNDLRFLKQF